MKRVILAGAVALIPLRAFAQTPGATPAPPAPAQGAAAVDAGLATPTGHAVNFGVGGYDYVEPAPLKISIHGPKYVAEYTLTLSLGERRRWFAHANLRGSIGSAAYDGWCYPWVITPNAASPNGYALGFGEASPCSETGDLDWYAEGRFLVGKDFIGRTWGWSPYTGLGFRHLSNGTTGVPGFRTDDYLYLPLGVTARTRAASHGVLSLNLELDPLIHGWQTTRNPALGGGDVPATEAAPAFSIDGVTDISFAQRLGWAIRTSAKYQMTRSWSVEPYYVRWGVGDSPVSSSTATFTGRIRPRSHGGVARPDPTRVG